MSTVSSNNIILGGGVIRAEGSAALTADWTSDRIETIGSIGYLFKFNYTAVTGSTIIYIKGNFQNDTITGVVPNWYDEKWRNNSGDWETSKTITATGTYVIKIFMPPSYLWVFADWQSGSQTVAINGERIG